MKCPRLTVYERDEHGNTTPAFGECIKEDCAWWDDSAMMCSFTSLCDDIYSIRITLAQLTKTIKEWRSTYGD